MLIDQTWWKIPKIEKKIDFWGSDVIDDQLIEKEKTTALVQKYCVQNLDVDVINRKLLIHFSLFQAFSWVFLLFRFCWYGEYWRKWNIPKHELQCEPSICIIIIIWWIYYHLVVVSVLLWIPRLFDLKITLLTIEFSKPRQVFERCHICVVWLQVFISTISSYIHGQRSCTRWAVCGQTLSWWGILCLTSSCHFQYW